MGHDFGPVFKLKVLYQAVDYNQGHHETGNQSPDQDTRVQGIRKLTFSCGREKFKFLTSQPIVQKRLDDQETQHRSTDKCDRK